LRQLFSVEDVPLIEKNSQEKQHHTDLFMLTTALGMYHCVLTSWYGAVVTLPSTRCRRQTSPRLGAAMAFPLIPTTQNHSNIHLISSGDSEGVMMA